MQFNRSFLFTMTGLIVLMLLFSSLVEAQLPEEIRNCSSTITTVATVTITTTTTVFSPTTTSTSSYLQKRYPTTVAYPNKRSNGSTICTTTSTTTTVLIHTEYTCIPLYELCQADYQCCNGNCVNYKGTRCM